MALGKSRAGLASPVPVELHTTPVTPVCNLPEKGSSSALVPGQGAGPPVYDVPKYLTSREKHVSSINHTAYTNH